MKKRGRDSFFLLLLTTAVVIAADRDQVAGDFTPDRVYLAAERLMVERQYPAPPQPLPPSLDEQYLLAAELHALPTIRQAAVRAAGRFEDPRDVLRIGRHISDPDARVRRETAHALVQALVNAKPVEDAKAIEIAFDLLRSRVLVERVGAVEDELLQCLGELPLSERQAVEAERILLERIRPSRPEAGALLGLEAWYRRHPNRPVSDEMRARLRQLSIQRPVEASSEPFLPAIEALRAIGDTHERTITSAAAYRCPPGPPPECGWEIRRVAVLMMSGAADRFSQELNRRLDDAHYLVRLEAVRAVAHSIPTTRSCFQLIGALNDLNRHVVLTAIELLDPQCEDREEALARLRSWALELGNADVSPKWQERTRALVTMAKFVPEEAVRLASEMAVRHEVWHVREAAVRVAELTRTEPLALELARDKEPNVRTAVLNALATMGSNARVALAIDALGSDDVQLVLTAASILKKGSIGAAALDDTGIRAVQACLTRLTSSDREPTRVARVELLKRLGEWGSTTDDELLSVLREYLKDVDPFVATAAADALGAITGTRPNPEPVRRPLEQPTETDLKILREGLIAGAPAVIYLSDGPFVSVWLVPNDAPLTAARFVKRAEAGYYNGLEFHRVVADLLMAGGSPGANDYSADKRFWPDEISPTPVMPGSFGLWAPGRHTGAGQFFISTLPAPRHRSTLFGRACVPENLVEGAIIREITVGRLPIGEPCSFF